MESQNKESYNKKLEDRNRETDNIIVLAEEKLFIVIETKSRLKNQMNSVQTLKKAAEQQKKRRKLFIGDHKNILDRCWRLVTLVAFPFIENKTQAFANKICDSCLDFTLDKNNISNLEQWVKEILQCDPIQEKEEQEVAVDRSYVNLYNRLVGFMSMTTKFGLSSNVFMDSAKARKYIEENILGKI